MARRKKPGPPRPTDAELEILRVLWRRGPSTVREIHETLAADDNAANRDIGYTTVLKFLQIMHEKGIVMRDEKNRAHIYAPAASKEHTQRQLLGDFVGDVFEGSAAKLVLQALGTSKPSDPDELRRIREMLDQLEAGASGEDE